jgi:glutathione synthase/RimK-type ligase-like ATP-grasp enzyme
MHPFLCNFVNRTYTLPRTEPTDAAQFMREKGFLSKNRNEEKVLIITQNYDIEADLLGIYLLKHGIDYVRLNVDDIPESVRVNYSISNDSKDLKFNIKGSSFDPSNISVTVLRYHELSGFNFGSNELDRVFSVNQWQNVLNSLECNLNCQWINSPYSNQLSELKPIQLSAAKKAGFDIPSSLITNDPKLARDFHGLHNKNTVIKSLLHHRYDVHNKAYLIFTHVISNSDLQTLDTLVYAPCILQERIQTKYELRVTVIEDTVLAVRLDLLKSPWDDIHNSNDNQIVKTPIDLTEDIREKCRKLVASLGLKYGALDLVIDNSGRTVFLEINPMGDWYWVEKSTGLPITNTVVKLIQKYISK